MDFLTEIKAAFSIESVHNPAVLRRPARAEQQPKLDRRGG